MKKLFIVSAIIFLTTFSNGIAKNRHYQRSKIESKMLLRDSVYKMLESLCVKYPEVGTAQAMLETGDFTSHLFRKRNNLFGIKKRYMHGRHSTVRYASYETLYESCEDYAAYYRRRIEPNIKSREDYLRSLKHYSATGNYISLVRRIVLRTTFEHE